jgi:hypothetical protein
VSEHAKERCKEDEEKEEKIIKMNEVVRIRG